jgi:AbiV
VWPRRVLLTFVRRRDDCICRRCRGNVIGHTVEMATLTPQEARTFWKALMDNASALISAAHLLLNSMSLGRARSHMVLAQEELGKALWIYDAFESSWSEGNGESRQVPNLPRKKRFRECAKGPHSERMPLWQSRSRLNSLTMNTRPSFR